ncbi:MAG TPA: hypothetical protein VG125_09400, partial [Pirellulales bacterium]|nr:hypothetical protein [Pirellulales bacterium]
MTIGMLPLAIVAIVLFVVLLGAIVNGRVWSAIVGLGGFLLVIGGFLLVGSLVLLRPVALPHPTSPIEELAPLPRTARPYKIITQVNESPPAERPEQPDKESFDQAPVSAEALTDE